MSDFRGGKLWAFRKATVGNSQRVLCLISTINGGLPYFSPGTVNYIPHSVPEKELHYQPNSTKFQNLAFQPLIFDRDTVLF